MKERGSWASSSTVMSRSERSEASREARSGEESTHLLSSPRPIIFITPERLTLNVSVISSGESAFGVADSPSST